MTSFPQHDNASYKFYICVFFKTKPFEVFFSVYLYSTFAKRSNFDKFHSKAIRTEPVNYN